MNIDNIVKELLAGKTTDEIAAEMAEALNDAIKQKEEIEREAAEQEEKARVKAEAEAAERTHKIQCMRRIFEHVGLYVGEFHDENFGTEIMDKVDNDEDVWDLCEQFDELVEGFLAILQFADAVKSNKDAKFDTDIFKQIFGL